ncbi:MAG: NADH-quinone oxidoreductase subunit NuoF [Actinomycetota bacterium]|nr:NADH-quinone oxidoreductase subunit NuoF [Actinomycetota bacterium]
MNRLKSPKELEILREEILSRKALQKVCVSICLGTSCHAFGGKKVSEAFQSEIERRGIKNKVEIKNTGCHGFCEKGPIVVIHPDEICYVEVKPEDAQEIVSETIVGGKIVERLLYKDPNTGEKYVHESEIPFHKFQTKIVFDYNNKVSPRSIDDYIALGGYLALKKAIFEMTPENVLSEIKEANLRGRGGGGFDAGRKWESARNASGSPKYVVVNCDEGDPGAYMDRSLMEENPHIILEGLTLGAYAIGSNKGFIYVREEYPYAVENALFAIEQARERGLLGKNILGSGFSFDVDVHRGAGAFVSGESSALLTTLEGLVGEPRPKYIHMAEKGLWGKPTNLNNVETWANVPLIISNGSSWFRSIGTEGSKGTKIFSLVGKVNNTGLIEVPMGITLRDIIYKIGGGIKGEKKFKAVQTGGPSGGCIPEQYLDTPVDFDELTKLGSMMGSGGMIVMDEDTCMVDVAKYFTDFLKDESCGKCAPCREGLDRMSEILERITEGKGMPEDIELLLKISSLMKDASLCALGTTAPNPVLSTIRYFRDEYDAHIIEKRCPALACRNLVEYLVDETKCTGCGACVKSCPSNAISGKKKKAHSIDQGECINCGICFDICKFDAVVKR